MITPGLFLLIADIQKVNKTSLLQLLREAHSCRRISSLISRIGFVKIATVRFLPDIDKDSSDH
jgi:hypothetical protein